MLHVTEAAVAAVHWDVSVEDGRPSRSGDGIRMPVNPLAELEAHAEKLNLVPGDGICDASGLCELLRIRRREMRANRGRITASREESSGLGPLNQDSLL